VLQAAERAAQVAEGTQAATMADALLDKLRQAEFQMRMAVMIARDVMRSRSPETLQ
jgi:hypothetical protein